MNNYSKVGGVGALLTGVTFLLVLVYQLVLIPGAGLAGAGARDPAKVFAAVGVFQFAALVNLATALTLTLFVVGLYERFHAATPVLMRLAAVSGMAAITLFLASGMANFYGLPLAAGIYSANPSAGAPLLAIGVALRGILLGAVFAGGWFDLLLSWAALRTGGLPRPAGYLGLLVGALFILNFVLPPPITLLGPLLGIVWTAWLGIALWREPASAAVPGQSPA